MSGHKDLTLSDVLLFEAGLESGRLEGAAEIDRLTRELEEARGRERTWRDVSHRFFRLIDHLDECGECYAKPCDEWNDMMAATGPLAKALATPQEASDG